MKIENIPGLTYSIFPGLTRNTQDGLEPYIATSKIAVLSGDAPTEAEVKALTNFDQFVIDNASKVVFQQDINLNFEWDGARQKRTIQLNPVGSVEVTATNVPTAVSAEYPAESIPLESEGLWAIIKMEDKDASLNTEGNDIVIFTPNVGTASTNFVSIDKVPTEAAEVFKMVNITISLFKGYQSTDEVIEIEDPENPGQMIPVGSKKSVYFNDVMMKRISEAYRKILVPANDSRTPLDMNIYSISTTGGVYNASNIYISSNQPFHNALYLDGYSQNPGYEYTHVFDGLMGNQSLVDILDDILTKIKDKTFPLWKDTFYGKTYSPTDTPVEGFDYYRGDAHTVLSESVFTHIWGWTYNQAPFEANEKNQLAQTMEKLDEEFRLNGLVVYQSLFHTNETVRNRAFQFLVDKCGYDQGKVDRAKLSLKGYNLDQENFASSYANGTLTVQYTKPFHLDSKFKQSVHNPTNENMYLILNSKVGNQHLNENVTMLNQYEGIKASSMYQWNHNYTLGYAEGTGGRNNDNRKVRRPLFEMATSDIVNGTEPENASYRACMENVVMSIAENTNDPENPNTEDIVLNDSDIITSFDGFAALFTIANKH